jgi:hypothetical protein
VRDSLCLCVYVRVYADAHERVSVYACACVCVGLCMYLYLYLYVCVPVPVPLSVPACVCVSTGLTRVCGCMHIWIGLWMRGRARCSKRGAPALPMLARRACWPATTIWALTSRSGQRAEFSPSSTHALA